MIVPGTLAEFAPSTRGTGTGGATGGTIPAVFAAACIQSNGAPLIHSPPRLLALLLVVLAAPHSAARLNVLRWWVVCHIGALNLRRRNRRSTTPSYLRLVRCSDLDLGLRLRRRLSRLSLALNTERPSGRRLRLRRSLTGHRLFGNGAAYGSQRRS